MTKAMYKIGKTYKEMIRLHNKEIKNHTNLVNRFLEASSKTKMLEKKIIFNLEAKRNIEHREGHIKMVKIYKELV
jgi:hypothetical protein